MAGSVNKVILIGNLGKDPEIVHFENGGVIAKFSIATTESYKNRETGERITLPTDWHNIVVKRSALAKVVENYLKKGSPVYIEGKLRYRSYDKDGETRYVSEIHVDELTMLGSRETPSASASPAATNNPSTNEPSEDDLPF